MFIYKEKSFFGNIIVVVLNFFVLLFSLAGLFGMQKIRLDLGVLILVFVSSIGCSLAATNYVLKHTYFNLTEKSEIQKRDAFKWIFLVVELVFFFCFGLSIVVGIQFYDKMREGWQWTIFLPSVVFLINALYAPNLHPLLFESALS